MRLRKKAWAIDEIATSLLIIKEPEKYKGNWSSVFGNGNPLHIEIGCGKGGFICGMAEANRDINFVGIERSPKIIAMALKEARLRELKNVYFINADASTLAGSFGAKEAERVYINFCDPWGSKKKWEKRRLTHRLFLGLYRGILSGGVFFKTDSKVLFDFSLREFLETGWRVEKATYNLHNESYAEGLVKTEYEEKFILKGQAICRLEAYLQ